MAYASGIHSGEAGLSGRIGDFVNDLRDRWRRYKLYRETLRELNLLSDRDLVDLGIHRSQVQAIAIEAAYGR